MRTFNRICWLIRWPFALPVLLFMSLGVFIVAGLMFNEGEALESWWETMLKPGLFRWPQR